MGDGATLNLNFSVRTYYGTTGVNFPNGNTYSCRVGDEVTIRLKNSDTWGYGASFAEPTLTFSGCEVVSSKTTCNQHSSHSNREWYNCGFTHEIVIKITDSNASLAASLCGSNWPENGNSVTIKSNATPEPEPTDPPVTDPTEPEEPEIVRPGYPTAVKTGYSVAQTLYFYNFDATSAAVNPLPGCVYEIRSKDGSYVRTVTSGDSLEVYLPEDIPVGDYIITEISAPYGYLRDHQYTREFSIGTSEHFNGLRVFKDSAIGCFMNHALDDLGASKTAEVEDYNNRTYEIILSAGAHVKLYEMEPIDVLFVVDQSNSMLFPAGLNDTGHKITLYQNPSTDNRGRNQNEYPLDQLNLDKNQVYYIIADPEKSATVFAIWHDGTSWMYQDASYYAKAWHNNAEGYQGSDIAVFPKPNQGFQDTKDGERANGGDLGYPIGGTLSKWLGTNGNKTFTLYTASNQYNRLHYLEQAITNMTYQLADANPENTITVIRFTKVVDKENCLGPVKTTPASAEDVVASVDSIKTDGGTRQDLGLEHAVEHLSGKHGEYTADRNHTYTILITDGAPVASGDDTVDEIYENITTQANEVKKDSTLITVALGMESVKTGKQKLHDIASSHPEDSNGEKKYAAEPHDAAELEKILYDLIFSELSAKEHGAIPGDITDVISDSFYPIAWVPAGQAASTGRQLLYSESGRDWVVLEPGDWIDIEGRWLGTQKSENAEGRLIVNSNGDLELQWDERNVTKNPNWSGSFFVKAKEDFIGGNAVDTNKSADVEIHRADDSSTISYLQLPTPTVNVRLLDMNQHSSEVIVFLGDLINEEGSSPLNALEYFYNNTRFGKLEADLPNLGSVDYGPIMNAVDPDGTDDGLEQDVFYLRYAMGKDLTAEQWAHLMASEENTVTMEYTYDDDSSHGPVGYFTFRLTKTGDTADYNTHPATVAGEHVEDYTLHVTYTAYELGDKRPDGNVHNGTGNPGTEVADENGSGLLEAGYGIVDKDSTHIVNVIEGAIKVTKEITPELVSGIDQTFRFTLHRAEDGDVHTGDRHLEIVIPAGQTTATVSVDHLPRGNWVLTEQASDVHNIRDLNILDTTNCYSTNNGTSAVFHIGYNTSDLNVIGKPDGARFTSYTGTPNGVFGEAKVVNEKTVYYAEIPVQKAWSGQVPSDPSAEVYVVLYRTVDGVEQLMLDTAGHARVLRLDAAGSWQGVFRVALPSKDSDVTTLGYFVREVSGVTTEEPEGGQPAILENDGTTLLYYTQTAQTEDVLELYGNLYMVTYEQPEPGTLQVTNHLAVVLPSTGGSGTKPYTISGLLLLAAALIIGYNQRRRRERGTES